MQSFISLLLYVFVGETEQQVSSMSARMVHSTHGKIIQYPETVKYLSRFTSIKKVCQLYQNWHLTFSLFQLTLKSHNEGLLQIKQFIPVIIHSNAHTSSFRPTLMQFFVEESLFCSWFQQKTFQECEARFISFNSFLTRQSHNLI